MWFNYLIMALELSILIATLGICIWSTYKKKWAYVGVSAVLGTGILLIVILLGRMFMKPCESCGDKIFLFDEICEECAYCDNCHGAIDKNDAFCAGCGYKIN